MGHCSWWCRCGASSDPCRARVVGKSTAIEGMWCWHGIHWGFFLKVLESRLEASEYGGLGTNPRCPALMLFSVSRLDGAVFSAFFALESSSLGRVLRVDPEQK